MAPCAYCGKDQGRRRCPALRGLISPSCCGRNRGVRITCPPHCKYFKAHEEYQRARLGPEFHQAWITHTEPFYQKGQMDLIDFIAFLELSIYQYFLQQTRGTDEDIKEALEFLKRQLSPIKVIETSGSSLGKHLWEGARAYLEDRPAVDHEQAQEAVGVLINVVKSLKGGAEPRQALQGLLGHVERYIGVPLADEKPSTIETPHVITPDELRQQSNKNA